MARGRCELIQEAKEVQHVQHRGGRALVAVGIGIAGSESDDEAVEVTPEPVVPAPVPLKARFPVPAMMLSI